MFEAGAVAKRLDVSRLVPLCVDMKPSEVDGPLHSFQARQLNKDGMWRLVRDLNKAADQPMTEKKLDILLDRLWPSFVDMVRPFRIM
jgi:hypothetical protein